MQKTLPHMFLSLVELMARAGSGVDDKLRLIFVIFFSRFGSFFGNKNKVEKSLLSNLKKVS
jgi:hypothetical protein